MTTDRQAFREAVATVAEKAKAILPVSTNGRVESAVKLVLGGDVFFCDDGTIEVGSSEEPLKTYHLHGTVCDCADYPRAPDGWCKHRISAGIAKRVGELLPQAPSGEPEPVTGQLSHDTHAKDSMTSLPEAPASVNVRLVIAGRECQLTLRDSDEGRLLARLQTVLAQYPLEAQTASAPVPVCPYHGALKASTKGKGWYCPAKMADGSYCKEKGQ
jgi:hypothetical protein